MEEENKKEKLEEKDIETKSEIGEEDKVDKEIEKNVPKDHNNQLKWILIILGIFIVGLIVSTMMGNDEASYEYVGLQWEKELFGNKIPIHSTYIMGYSVGGRAIDFKMPFRNDPRKLDIPIEGDLNLIINKPMYMSIDLDSNISECGTLGLVGFGRFMAEMGFETVSAVPNEELAEEHDRPLANCESNPDNTVFILRKGVGKSKIVQNDNFPNCYYLEVGENCEDVEVLEKLQIAIISEFTKRPF
jgi:hypothetical protein